MGCNKNIDLTTSSCCICRRFQIESFGERSQVSGSWGLGRDQSIRRSRWTNGLALHMATPPRTITYFCITFWALSKFLMLSIAKGKRKESLCWLLALLVLKYMLATKQNLGTEHMDFFGSNMIQWAATTYQRNFSTSSACTKEHRHMHAHWCDSSV